MTTRTFRASNGFILAAIIMAASLWYSEAFAQTQAEDTTQSEAQLWQPPDLSDLPPDWWTRIAAASPETTRVRVERFFEAAQERISGLDPDNFSAGQTALSNLHSLSELHAVTEQDLAEPQFDPIPTQDRYFLDDVLALQEQTQSLEKSRVQIGLEIDQSERKLKLLQERRDRLLRRYQASAKESPERVLLGLERITARLEYETELLRIDRQRKRLNLTEDQVSRLEEQQKFALAQLDARDTSIEDLQQQLAEARARAVTTNEKIAGLQKQLLDVVSATPVNRSLEQLRGQQLTRASADASLAQLETALVTAKLDWYLFREGQLDSDFNISQEAANSRRLTQEINEQLDVWTSSSQATLVDAPRGDSANAMGNFQIAQSVARETLVIIGQIRDIGNELVLVRTILSDEVINSQSGIGKAWSRIVIAFGNAWERIGQVLEFNLFSMGDVPVTPGGIIKMVFILALAWGFSWIVRHMLERLGRRKQFANSPALYTLGRLAHYLIITIGAFASLASIGMDFSNFALIAGALSVGIGFGLQAIVSNFVSGLILLFEGSLRVGDYIELDSGLRGVVREINTRATVVNTNDGVDVVVPNSELVTFKLTNWTLRESMARLRMDFGVAYGSDKEVVKQLALEAAQDVEFAVLNLPGREPQVRLVGFGDSSLDFQLLVWVRRHGVRRPNRVTSSFLWSLETKLKEAGIEIPFPQRDLHIKTDSGSGDDPGQVSAEPA